MSRGLGIFPACKVDRLLLPCVVSTFLTRYNKRGIMSKSNAEPYAYVAIPATQAEKAIYKAHARKLGISVAAFARQAMDERLSPEDRALLADLRSRAS